MMGASLSPLWTRNHGHHLPGKDARVAKPTARTAAAAEEEGSALDVATMQMLRL